MGAGCKLLSSTYIVVFAMGRPTGMVCSADVTGWTADQTVVSVGPYMFHTEDALDISCLARSRDIASPPHRTFKFALPVQPASISSFQADGVACITVMSWSSNMVQS